MDRSLPRSFLRILARTAHDFENRSDARAGVLNVFIPGGFETLMPQIVAYMVGQAGPTRSLS